MTMIRKEIKRKVIVLKGMYPMDIAEHLRAVDNAKCLGLEHHFSMKIKQVMDYVFEHWSEKGIGFGREAWFLILMFTA